MGGEGSMAPIDTSDSQTVFERELERLTEAVGGLIRANAKLQEENAALEARLTKAAKRAPKKLEARVRALEEERRQWERQRTQVADKIENMLGKFQWLERERAAQARGRS